MKRAFVIGMVVVALGAGSRPNAQSTRRAEEQLKAAQQLAEVEGDLQKAIAAYEQVLDRFRDDKAIAAKAQLHIGLCYEQLGNVQASRVAYERVVRDYGDQPALVTQARSGLARQAASGSTSRDAVVARQIWTGPDVNVDGGPSLDGRMLSFLNRSNSSIEVGVRDLTTGQNRVLVRFDQKNPGYASTPVLSPDGRHLAFVAEHADGSSEIRIVDADGTASRTLFQQSGTAPWGIVWSPDGKRLAASLVKVGQDQTSQIALVSVQDGSVTQLKSTGWRRPTLGGFSPDGRFLVYSLSASSDSQKDGGIFAIATDGSSEGNIAQGPARDTSPAWTPDGRAVVFVSDRSGTKDLWMVRVAGASPVAPPERLRGDIGEIMNMGFTADGTFFYGLRNREKNVYVAGLDPRTLEITEAPTRVSEHFVGRNWGPSWSPDGRLLAFLRETAPNVSSVVIRSLADGVERVLPTRFGPEGPTMFGPAWFPDSRSLLVSDVDAAARRLICRRVNIDTGLEERVFEDNVGGLWNEIKVSPDGKTLFFTRREAGPKTDTHILRLVRRDIASGEEVDVYRSISIGIGFFGLGLSPRGDRIAFTANTAAPNERVLLTIPSTGGDGRELQRGNYSVLWPWGTAWTIDGRHVLTVTTGAGAFGLMAFPVDGGAPRTLDLQAPEHYANRQTVGSRDISAVVISPDGRHLAFTGAERRSEVWTIKNLIPDLHAAK
jgi:Tol biopolymer transport system component